ncbi:pyrimidine reductase family protein [Streptomyces spiramenti]|uniref:Pyrimidine reductase family protein n=1 Tax=Streptomyces spiramenti TaxID=2720606 RepID=A0ABX1AD05_9ACTN|nr:pyrimidine reductase family protein [Streptomyces spiramenti]NJP65063.1 pyrimidine reductase family protein [Streptomyces spiramenti]
MRRLIPAPEPAAESDEGLWELSEIARAYTHPTPPEGWLRANMVASLDGAVHHQGRSQPLSGEADMRIFGVLRQLADVVLVGAQTVRAEGYRPARRREEFAAAREAAGQSPAPAVAVVSGSLDLDLDAPLFTAPHTPTLLLTGAEAPADRLRAARAAGAVVVTAGDGVRVDAARIKPELARLGHRRVLCEGGPRLLGELAAAESVDELCLTLSPRLALGDAGRIAAGPALTAPTDFAPVSLLEHDGFLFTRHVRGGVLPGAAEETGTV